MSWAGQQALSLSESFGSSPVYGVVFEMACLQASVWGDFAPSYNRQVKSQSYFIEVLFQIINVVLGS